MKSINDNSKRHDEITGGILNDIHKESFVFNTLSQRPLEQSFFVATQKIEKIVTALHLISDIMDQDYALTDALRNESLGLMNTCYTLLGSQEPLNSRDTERVSIALEHLLSLISIGTITHHISEMNARVLSQEIHKIAQVVHRITESLKEKNTSYNQPHYPDFVRNQPTLSYTLFDDVRFDHLEKIQRKNLNDTASLKLRSVNTQQTVLSDIQKTTSSNLSDISKATLVSQNDIQKSAKNNLSDTASIKPRSADNQQKILTETKKPKAGNGLVIIDRKKEILNVITSHKNATMQDIQKYVTGCSDKTLQREINNLITMNLVRKTGDRRWATYHVV